MSVGESQLADTLFAGSDELRVLCRAVDWGATALGPVATWSPVLRAAVRICLDAKTTPMAIWAGPDLHLIYNEGYPAVLGPAKHPWALGRPGREVWPEFWDRLGPELRSVAERGASTHHEDERFLLRHGDREEEAFFTYSFTPIRDEDGRVIAVLNVFRETTAGVRAMNQREAVARQRLADLEALYAERNRAAEALAESERHYRALAENAQEVIARFDHEHRCTYVNEYGGRLYGLPPTEIVGKTMADLGMPASRVAFWTHHFGEALATGVHRTVDHEFDSPTFGHQHLSTMLVPERDETGRSSSILSITRDVTALKLVENALRESEERFRRLADAMPQVVWMARADGTVDFYNERVKELSGVQAHEDGTWSWQAVLHPDDAQATVEAWTRSVRTGEPYEVTHRVKRVDGTWHWFLSRGMAVRDERGRVARWFGTATDIDAQKRAEEALREADRHKNEFLAMLSHELRNPLAPMRNSIYILHRAEPGGEQARRAIAVIDRQVTQMARLIDDLLDVTRISRGKIHLQLESVELNEIVRRAGEDLREMFRRGGIDFLVVVPTPPLRARVDRTRIAQAIGNLLQNAAKFTSSGGQVILSLGSDDQGRGVIEVRDDGAGMQQELLGRLFQPFVQDDRTLDRSHGGLGLGLALVKGLVDLHGGTVAASSDGPGRGAVFTIRLPLEASARGDARPGTGDRPHPNRASLRVLVIEDNADAAASLKEVLELQGHTVELAFNGVEGIRVARATRPDVILCDIGLPQLDGYGVARALRADAELRGTFLVALSGYALREDLERSEEAGFDCHIPKPPNLVVLERTLSDVAIAARDR